MKQLFKHRLMQLFAMAITVMATTFNIQAQALLLVPSNYNGYNISCAGANDGSINLTIRGLLPPYTITWSNNETTQNISKLTAGNYFIIKERTSHLRKLRLIL